MFVDFAKLYQEKSYYYANKGAKNMKISDFFEKYILFSGILFGSVIVQLKNNPPISQYDVLWLLLKACIGALIGYIVGPYIINYIKKLVGYIKAKKNKISP